MSTGDATTEITDASAFEHRSLGKMVLFFVITFGIYGIYWIHQVNVQIEAGTTADYNPLMRTIGLIIPIYNLIVLWRLSHDAEAVTDQDGPILFLFWIVISPVAWYLIADGINETAQGH